MMRFTLQQAAQITGARICGDHNIVFEGVAIDSRAVRPEQLFVAFRGEHQDGHDYVADARKAGCAVALVQDAVDDGPSLVVADVQLALAQLAGHWRSALDVKVVGVTGSNGKTTVKNILATILQQQAPHTGDSRKLQQRNRRAIDVGTTECQPSICGCGDGGSKSRRSALVRSVRETRCGHIEQRQRCPSARLCQSGWGYSGKSGNL